MEGMAAKRGSTLFIAIQRMIVKANLITAARARNGPILQQQRRVSVNSAPDQLGKSCVLSLSLQYFSRHFLKLILVQDVVVDHSDQ